MAIDSQRPGRRDALKLVACGLGILACQRARAGWALGDPGGQAQFAMIETNANSGHSWVLLFDHQFETVARVPLGHRAHGMAEHDGTLVVFPRRPGNQMAIVTLASAYLQQTVACPENRRFTGHGAFSGDGRWLLTAENDLDSLGGWIGVYDAKANFRREGEIALPLPGPHELVRSTLEQRDQFLICLGGLETHPDYGRRGLNTRTFTSDLAVLDFDTLDLRVLDAASSWLGTSMRHLALMPTGTGETIWLGGQVKDPERAGANPPVAWRIKAGVIEAVDLGGQELNGYVSSVAANANQVTFSSKQAGLALSLDTHGKTINRLTLPGASALGYADARLIAAGFGVATARNHRWQTLPDSEFDNHLITF